MPIFYRFTWKELVLVALAAAYLALGCSKAPGDSKADDTDSMRGTGAVLEISANHPTADGRAFGALVPGDTLDQVEIVDVAVIPYEHPYTHDILPDSDTGIYYAGGVAIGSTLF